MTISVSEANNSKCVIDGIFDDMIAGWAICDNPQTQPAQLMVAINGESGGSTVADRYRQDLKEAGICEGECGYRIKLPERFRQEDSLHIEVACMQGIHVLTTTAIKATRNPQGWHCEPVSIQDTPVEAEAPSLPKDDRSIIFLTTPTSATGSMWRIMCALGAGNFDLTHFTNSFYEKGRIDDLQHATIPPKGLLALFNVPHLFNKELDVSKYRFILNARDPRDLGCNQYHWALQHPSPTKSEEELAEERRIVEEKGIDQFLLEKDYNPLFTNYYRIVEMCPPEQVHIATYAQVCLEFDTYIENLCAFLGVEPNEKQRELLEAERVDNLEDNPEWIGNQWKGSDTLPGRYRRELKDETITLLNQKYARPLNFLAAHDHPSVRGSYTHERDAQNAQEEASAETIKDAV